MQSYGDFNHITTYYLPEHKIDTLRNIDRLVTRVMKNISKQDSNLGGRIENGILSTNRLNDYYQVGLETVPGSDVYANVISPGRMTETNVVLQVKHLMGGSLVEHPVESEYKSCHKHQDHSKVTTAHDVTLKRKTLLNNFKGPLCCKVTFLFHRKCIG